MKNLFYDSYLDWKDRWSLLMNNIVYDSSEKWYQFICLITILAIFSFYCIYMNAIKNEEIRREELRENIEYCMDMNYKANINGIELNSLDSEFIESAPIEFNVAFDEESKVILFTSKEKNNKNKMTIVPIMFR